MKYHHCIFAHLLLIAPLYANESGRVLSHFSLALETKSFDYREFDTDGTLLDSEQSNSLRGVSLGFDVPLGNNDRLSAKQSWLSGNTQYIGFYLGSGGSYGEVRSITKNTFLEGNLDYTLYRPSKFGELLWSVGGGYRYWGRQLSDGHFEEYFWPYAKTSIGTSLKLSPYDRIKLTTAYHHALNPKMFSNYYGTFNLGKTEGFELSIPWRSQYTEHWSTEMRYSYTQWTIGRSNVINKMVEPDSKTLQHTATLTLMYHF